MTTVPTYYGGLSGIKLPYPRYRYPQEYQQASRLHYYATLFNSIEVNSSFYKIPGAATITRWSSEVPDHFRFTFKLYKGITHCKNLDFDVKLVDEFVSNISVAGVKVGCILLQLPPSLTSLAYGNLHALLEMVRSREHSRNWNLAVEFRNADWYREEVFEMLSDFSCATVLHDKKASASPFAKATSGGLVYWRFHGPTGNYSGSYTDSFLLECAQYIKEWMSDQKQVYVYFNNTKGDDAFHNLNTLNSALRELLRNEANKRG